MTNSIYNINSLTSTSSLMGGCNCKSSSNDVFDMVLISLLKAVSETNKNNSNSYHNQNDLYDSINNIFNGVNNQYNNINNVENNTSNGNISNSINTSNRVESCNKDKNINARIDSAIAKASQKYGVDENLIRAIIKVESNFDPNVVSRAGATGLMQLMPQYWGDLGVTDPFNIEQNIDGGTKEIKRYLNMYDGDVEMALMAYNGGCGRMAKRGVKSAADIYKMPKETQAYVPKVMKYYKG